MTSDNREGAHAPNPRKEEFAACCTSPTNTAAPWFQGEGHEGEDVRGGEGGGVERHDEREEGLEPGRHGGEYKAGAGQARQDPAQGADEAGEGGRGQDGQPGPRLHSPPPLRDDSQGWFQCIF